MNQKIESFFILEIVESACCGQFTLFLFAVRSLKALSSLPTRKRRYNFLLFEAACNRNRGIISLMLNLFSTVKLGIQRMKREIAIVFVLFFDSA